MTPEARRTSAHLLKEATDEITIQPPPCSQCCTGRVRSTGPDGGRGHRAGLSGGFAAAIHAYTRRPGPQGGPNPWEITPTAVATCATAEFAVNGSGSCATCGDDHRNGCCK